MSRQRKPHGRTKRLTRRVNTRALRQRFLIVCEGTKTEPAYFKGFRVPKKVVVIGVGVNTVSLVKKAIKLKENDEYDQVWCVFDKDNFPVEQFNQALTLAKQQGIDVAYSNEAFELWYLLHFDYHNTAISRASYQRRLSEKLGTTYQKNSLAMYDLLAEKQAEAIRNATRLLQQYGDSHRPAYDNPSTTVHWLVEALNHVAV